MGDREKFGGSNEAGDGKERGNLTNPIKNTLGE